MKIVFWKILKMKTILKTKTTLLWRWRWATQDLEDEDNLEDADYLGEGEDLHKTLKMKMIRIGPWRQRQSWRWRLPWRWRWSTQDLEDEDSLEDKDCLADEDDLHKTLKTKTILKTKTALKMKMIYTRPWRRKQSWIRRLPWRWRWSTQDLEDEGCLKDEDCQCKMLKLKIFPCKDVHSLAPLQWSNYWCNNLKLQWRNIGIDWREWIITFILFFFFFVFQRFATCYDTL